MHYLERLKHREKHVKELMVRELEYVLRNNLSLHLHSPSYDMYYAVKRAHEGVSNIGLTTNYTAVNSYAPVSIHKVIDAFY
jgi:hypothetical protein